MRHSEHRIKNAMKKIIGMEEWASLLIRSYKQFKKSRDELFCSDLSGWWKKKCLKCQSSKKIFPIHPIFFVQDNFCVFMLPLHTHRTHANGVWSTIRFLFFSMRFMWFHFFNLLKWIVRLQVKMFSFWNEIYVFEQIWNVWNALCTYIYVWIGNFELRNEIAWMKIYLMHRLLLFHPTEKYF